MTDRTTPTLEARKLSCRRGRRRLFHELSFTLAAGEALHVAGPNGSGKTSLLRILAGLRNPDDGEVLWNGAAIRTQPDDFHAALCFLGHENGVKAELSPRENLRAAAALAGAGADAAEQALARMGLVQQADILCARLSAGQRQRVALARLLLRPVSLWLLDEPCASLDYASQRQVEGILSAHVRAGGMVVFTTHQSLSLDGLAVRRLELVA
ncbi:MAG: cytochrome c biogenesis heme-transporting ATPase CcmA [Nevskiales bacterium]